MLFKDISYLQLWQPFCSTEWNHLCKFGRGYHKEQFHKIILNLDQWFRFFSPFTLYSPHHLTYRRLERVIPLHPLQTTVKAFLWLIVSLAHPFHAFSKAVLKQFTLPRRHHSVVWFYLSSEFL